MALRLGLLMTMVVAVACSGATGTDPPANPGNAGNSGNPADERTGPADTAPDRRSIDNVRITLSRVARVESPTALTARPGTDDLYATSQTGRVVVLKATPAGDATRPPSYAAAAAPVLDVSDRIAAGGERGLLGLAFSPARQGTGGGEKLYVYYTDRTGRITVDEYAMRGDTADSSTRRNLLSIAHDRSNHNGGQLAFGPDGFLYVGIGDGGGGGDPDRNGQNPTTLLGKLLRIDPAAPTGGKPYGIPAGNPFADGRGGAPEVWAYGLRNPWRFSFDRTTGDLWIADVGQNAWEEINVLPADPQGAGRGANLGWNRMEGSHPYQGGSPPADHVAPIVELSHDDGNCSVIGGFVARGGDPQLEGIYLYGDFCVGQLRGVLARDGQKLDDRALGGTMAQNALSSFGQDNAGRIYATSLQGEVLRIDAA